MRCSSPRKGITELLPKYTLEAAMKIFEENDLGSLSPGKKPGLNLITGIRDEALFPDAGSMVKVLI
jgi:hypothetical protein